MDDSTKSVKRCCTCKSEKPLGDFGRDKCRTDGKNPRCKACVNAASRGKHKEYLREYYRRTWDVQRARRVANREQKAVYNRLYKERYAQWRKDRRANDPSWKLHQRVRHRILQALKRGEGLQKSASTRELLGIPPDQAKRWIESQFHAGMSWSNHGTKDGWEIDHVLPVSRFDLSHESEQRIAFSWTNLQPKWKQDNRSKHNRIVPREFFKVQLLALQFIQKEGLGSREYQRLGESSVWLRATTSGMVTSSWMTDGF